MPPRLACKVTVSCPAARPWSPNKVWAAMDRRYGHHFDGLVPRDVHARDAEGWTFLMFACGASAKPGSNRRWPLSMGLVLGLLKMGAPTDGFGMGEYPLVHCLDLSRLANLLPPLVAAGMDINQSLWGESDRKTLLMEICHRSCMGLSRQCPKESLALLIEQGADVTLEDNHGKTARDWARGGHRDMSGILREAVMEGLARREKTLLGHLPLPLARRPARL